MPIAMLNVVIIDDGVFADVVRVYAATRRLVEAAEGLASFREKRKPGRYPAAAWAGKIK